LIFNVSDPNLPYEAEIDRMLAEGFESVQKTDYGAFKETTFLCLPITILMYLFPKFRLSPVTRKIYYVAAERRA